MQPPMFALQHILFQNQNKISRSAYSGGSAKNWESVVSEDSEILLHNVNKNLYEEYLENPQEEYEIEVVTDSIDSAALKQEKELLLKRIKEIDHLLNCGE